MGVGQRSGGFSSLYLFCENEQSTANPLYKCEVDSVISEMFILPFSSSAVRAKLPRSNLVTIKDDAIRRVLQINQLYMDRERS